jgi:F-type H+-transporting ATPase subunit a
MPILWTIFFFILVNNLLGLMPDLDIVHLTSPTLASEQHRTFLGGTATQNIWVTGALAVIAGISSTSPRSSAWAWSATSST